MAKVRSNVLFKLGRSSISIFDKILDDMPQACTCIFLLCNADFNCRTIVDIGLLLHSVTVYIAASSVELQSSKLACFLANCNNSIALFSTSS